MKRAALFALTGLGFFAHWFVTKPSDEMSPTQGEWPYMLAFGAVILTLAFAVPQFADLVDGRVAFRASRVVAAGAMLSSIANVLEDGLKMEWAFFAFVLGAAIMDIGLLAFTVALAARRGQRHFALVPAGTMVAILFYVPVGGPLMLDLAGGRGVHPQPRVNAQPSALVRGIRRLVDPFVCGNGQELLEIP